MVSDSTIKDMENSLALNTIFDDYAVNERVPPQNLINWMVECNIISEFDNITAADVDEARRSVSIDDNGLTLPEVLCTIRILAKNKEKNVVKLNECLIDHANAGQLAEIQEDMLEDDKRKNNEEQSQK